MVHKHSPTHILSTGGLKLNIPMLRCDSACQVPNLNISNIYVCKGDHMLCVPSVCLRKPVQNLQCTVERVIKIKSTLIKMRFPF